MTILQIKQQVVFYVYKNVERQVNGNISQSSFKRNEFECTKKLNIYTTHDKIASFGYPCLIETQDLPTKHSITGR